MSENACAEPGCPNPVQARGLCGTHYARMRYHEKKQGEAHHPTKSPNGLAREPYLIAADAAEELGVPMETLTRMRKELGVGTERRPGLRVYTAGDVAKLRVLLGWMTDLGISAAVAARVARKVAKLRRDGVALPGDSP